MRLTGSGLRGATSKGMWGFVGQRLALLRWAGRRLGPGAAGSGETLHRSPDMAAPPLPLQHLCRRATLHATTSESAARRGVNRAWHEGNPACNDIEGNPAMRGCAGAGAGAGRAGGDANVDRSRAAGRGERWQQCLSMNSASNVHDASRRGWPGACLGARRGYATER